MGIIDGNIISAPLNTRDVGSVLGSASNDVATLCTHANINMWAKFKPVPLRAIFPEDSLKGSSDWNGNLQPGTHRPWWFGDGDSPAYIVPVISELADMGADGNQNSGAVWRYNGPTGKGASAAHPDFPFRLTDFVGYRHDARPPFTANLPLELTADNFTYFGVDMPDREQGELDLSDICDILHLSAVYIGIIIKNITRGITTAYVSTTALNANNSDSWTIPVVINNGSTIENGGAGQTISESDTIDVYLFLSTSAGETDWEAMTKYSALLTSDMHIYRRYKGYGHNIKIYTGVYTYVLEAENILDWGKIWYYKDSDGNIFSFRKTIDQISNPDSKVTVKLDSGSTAYDSLRATIIQKGNVKDVNTGKTVSLNLVYALAYNEGAGTIGTSNKNIVLADKFNSMSFAAYPTVDDANSESNIQWMRGMPVITGIEYNNADADIKGTVTDNTLDVDVAIYASSQYTRIDLTNDGTPVGVEQ